MCRDCNDIDARIRADDNADKALLLEGQAFGEHFTKHAIRKSLAKELWSSLYLWRTSRAACGPTYGMTVMAKAQLDGQRLMVIRLTLDGVI